NSSISLETLALSAKNAVSAFRRAYTCQASARQSVAATIPMMAENTRKRRWVSSGSVAKLTLRIISRGLRKNGLKHDTTSSRVDLPVHVLPRGGHVLGPARLWRPTAKAIRPDS